VPDAWQFQSVCPRLHDEKLLRRLLTVCQEESVGYKEEGLAALIFTAEGDMRNALSNLQATASGFNFGSDENVFKVCDQPWCARFSSNAPRASWMEWRSRRWSSERVPTRRWTSSAPSSGCTALSMVGREAQARVHQAHRSIA
jgi:hypothetical protein